MIIIREFETFDSEYLCVPMSFKKIDVLVDQHQAKNVPLLATSAHSVLDYTFHTFN